jgi:hypothetical protein
MTKNRGREPRFFALNRKEPQRFAMSEGLFTVISRARQALSTVFSWIDYRWRQKCVGMQPAMAKQLASPPHDRPDPG